MSIPGTSKEGGRNEEEVEEEVEKVDEERDGGGILQESVEGGVHERVNRLSTSVLKVCDSLQIDSLSSF